ncbi:MAG: sugar phosphate isomerase/epimerase [Candidatus Poribacteria bacterium]|nr:sugar phosphate isomerase/epimerase [Candidatus Poribacteria bacterium]
MKLGLCTIAFSEKPLEAVIDIAADYGFDGVELWGKPPHMPSEYDADAVKKIRDMVLRKGLEISAFGSYVNPLMAWHQRHLEDALKIAQGLGTDLVRIWSGGGPSKSLHPDEKRLITFRLIPLAQWAQFRRLTLGLEMHNNNLTDSVASILELIEEVKLPSLKTYYQPTFRPDADDPHEAATKLAPHIVNVHAQNADANGQACAIADGVVDYGKVLEVLAQRGYDGYVEVEFVHGEDKLAALQRDRDYLASLIGAFDEPLRHMTGDLV